MARPFRFAVQMHKLPAQGWIERVRRIEQLGYSTLFLPDHFGDQWEPTTASAAVAAVTERLNVGALVYDVDYRHPVVYAKSAATLQILSAGRHEFGIGAGWMQTDYDAAGMDYDRPGVRISRLEEALTVMKGIFADDPVTFAGKHYTVTNYNGLPKPVQKPHPPILLGGGGKRVLSLAAREADIIGVNFNLAQGAVNQEVMATGDATATEEKIRWIREAAGARFDDLEINVTVFVSIVTDDRDGMAQRISGGFGMPAADVLGSPHALIGSVEQIVETLQERRERYGFNYIAFSGDVFEQMAPVVAKLAGT